MTTKERPILMSAPMVRAILAGAKTQTRRVVKLPHANPLGRWEVLPWGGPNGGRTRDGRTVPFQNVIGHSRTGEIIGCPHGQPGDRLWVRETWAPDGDGGYLYRAECTPGTPGVTAGCSEADAFEVDRRCGESWARWRPSIHMPRAASRITLEVTCVHVERLQEISEVDSIDEGVLSMGQQWEVDTFADYFEAFGVAVSNGEKPPLGPSPRKRYAKLWEQINGPGSWDANPWVWVVSFNRASQTKITPAKNHDASTL